MTQTRLLVAVVLLLLVVLGGRHAARRDVSQSIARLPRWVLPLAGAVFTAALTTWIWGGWRARPVVDDEAAYLLQAQLFAHGHWHLASPAAFPAFTQSAVLLTPVLAPKMPPGHALLLAPGVALGLPGLVPVLLSALTAALLIVLVREIAGSGVAVLTLVIWLGQGSQMRWRASYFSEMTTGALWLLGWWLLLRWRKTRQSRWLLCLAVVTGWGAITRPLTMLAFAVPVGVVILSAVVRQRRWGSLLSAAVVGCLVLCILPLQNREVLGSWRDSPLQLYTRQYMPFDRLGLGYDSTPPLIPLPPDLQQVQDSFIARHREHQATALPAVLTTRLRLLWALDFRGWREVLVPGVVIGLFLLTAEGWFAIASLLALYLAYLAYAHEPQWTVYYLEATPVPAFVCALGLAWLITRGAGARRFGAILAGATVGAMILVTAPDWFHTRAGRINVQAPLERFAESVQALPAARVIVFVRYAEPHDPDLSLIRNVADSANAHALFAYDQGTAIDRQVLAAYPGRVGYLWTETDARLVPLPR